MDYILIPVDPERQRALPAALTGVGKGQFGGEKRSREQKKHGGTLYQP